MIFDTIYNFFYQLLYNEINSPFFENALISVPGGDTTTLMDYLCCLGTIFVIVLGVVALFRILGGVLRLFRV